jgi:hypothetical protein
MDAPYLIHVSAFSTRFQPCNVEKSSHKKWRYSITMMVRGRCGASTPLLANLHVHNAALVNDIPMMLTPEKSGYGFQRRCREDVELT